MDQTRTGGDGEQPRGAPGEEPAKRIISTDAPGAAAAARSGYGCFDCNICLECATEPVVTLCGHLYCWPCIYEWLRPDADAGAASSARRQCPVCKAAVSPDALVPLYGRGGSSSAKKPPASVPRRPALRQRAQGSGDGDGDGGGRHRWRDETDAPAGRTPRHTADARAARFDAALLPTTPFGDRGMMNSTAGGMLGGMAVAVLPMVLRGQAQPPGMYYSGTYHLMNTRERRWHMEVERSLHQLWFFLFVFVALCLVLF